jgi:hypothetical protein
MLEHSICSAPHIPLALLVDIDIVLCQCGTADAICSTCSYMHGAPNGVRCCDQFWVFVTVVCNSVWERIMLGRGETTPSSVLTRLCHPVTSGGFKL